MIAWRLDTWANPIRAYYREKMGHKRVKPIGFKDDLGANTDVKQS